MLMESGKKLLRRCLKIKPRIIDLIDNLEGTVKDIVTSENVSFQETNESLYGQVSKLIFPQTQQDIIFSKSFNLNSIGKYNFILRLQLDNNTSLDSILELNVYSINNLGEEALIGSTSFAPKDFVNINKWTRCSISFETSSQKIRVDCSQKANNESISCLLDSFKVMPAETELTMLFNK